MLGCRGPGVGWRPFRASGMGKLIRGIGLGVSVFRGFMLVLAGLSVCRGTLAAGLEFDGFKALS